MSDGGGGRRPEEVVRELEAAGVERVKLGAFDVDGIFRGKLVSFEKWKSALDHGLGFCDVIFGWDAQDVLYDNARFTGWHTGYPDCLAKVDLSTGRRVPWEGGVPLFLVDFWEKDGVTPLAVSPRQQLARVVRRAKELGYEPVMSCEFEFFFFRETPETLREKGFRALTPLSPGMFGYSVLRASRDHAFVDDLLRSLKAYDCELEGFHTETGPGVYEAAIRYDTAMRAADRAALFKTAVKELAARHGLIACFMAKWNQGLPGCSGHIHQSLWHEGHAHNLFRDDVGGGPSRLLRQYAAGQLATLREFAAFYAPTVNSYKRLVPGTWAPTSATWGRENRTTANRIIEGPSAKATRVEFRVTGADVNPYVAMAANLAAGLHGIENGLELPAETRGNAYEASAEAAPRLPRSHEAAVPLLKASVAARRYLDERFVDHYVATREWEVREAQKAVTTWELERYMEAI